LPGYRQPLFLYGYGGGPAAMEIKAEVILKATKVDGVYDADPMKVPNAKKYSQISYLDVLSQGLAVMDTTAISCAWTIFTIVVFNLNVPGNLKCGSGRKGGSLVSS